MERLCSGPLQVLAVPWPTRRRILNDEPSPALSARSPFASSSRSLSNARGHADVSSPSLSTMPAPAPRTLQHRPQSDAFSGPSSAQGRSEPHPHPTQWMYDPGSGPGDLPFGSPRTARDRASVHHQPISPIDHPPPPQPPQPVLENSTGNGKSDSPAKKRKKITKSEGDNGSSTGQRRSSRKSQRAKQSHSETPARFIPPSENIPGMSRHEDHSILSSDLEDCREIWTDELDQYVFESKTRYQRIENWFHASLKERTQHTAQRMSHYYSGKIARFPHYPPSPPPMPPPHFDEYSYASEPHEYPSQGYDASYDDDEYDADGPSFSRQGRAGEKRPAAHMVGDGMSEYVPPSSKHANKKRKLESGAADVDDGLGPTSLGPIPPSAKIVRGKMVPFIPSPHDGGLETIIKPSRKKSGLKKKNPVPLAPDLAQEIPSVPASLAGDMTPSISRASSPAPVNTGVIFEIDEIIPPLKKAKKMDDATMLKRVKALEDAQRKVWTNIARRDVVKVYKYHTMGFQARLAQSERIAKLASLQARRPYTRTAKTAKEVQAKAKRLMREMQVFWKKNEREERDVRKREHKEAMDRLKVEEELREAARQARKLEFLISQTELYSHFVGSKLKTAEVQGDEDSAGQAPAGADVTDTDPGGLQEINFDDEDKTNLYRHARHNAQEAIAMARNRAQQFDAQAAVERKTNEASKLVKEQAHAEVAMENEAGPSEMVTPAEETGLKLSGDLALDLDSDELNFQNPTSLSGQLTISQPKMLMAQLKEYQLKGLNWLGTLYEQGINGILADEMGLGKVRPAQGQSCDIRLTFMFQTVQSISLLAYLAETHDIWGPFLVVAPASTLHNWQQEITRFVPGLKALPYWGNVKDRATLRKFWSKKEISYNQEAPFMF
ncbi:hypothetical protein D9757_002808 [Collybiopsis confluens]|uniref:Chromatin-remodeling ATPase INO80 n=1 Tax=Collybiopsis confluens TaxID=2823264 RepID=A0A8H5HV94_9AGAR|nr:hypothetical protein D9757_002808 [Collybiopsis confluens]